MDNQPEFPYVGAKVFTTEQLNGIPAWTDFGTISHMTPTQFEVTPLPASGLQGKIRYRKQPVTGSIWSGLKAYPAAAADNARLENGGWPRLLHSEAQVKQARLRERKRNLVGRLQNLAYHLSRVPTLARFSEELRQSISDQTDFSRLSQFVDELEAIQQQVLLAQKRAEEATIALRARFAEEAAAPQKDSP